MLDSPGDTFPRVVSHSLTTTLLGHDESTSLEVDLHYDPSSPYAVTATFIGEGPSVSWTFGRDLLRFGLFEPVGSGDVHVRPSVDQHGHATVLIELHAPQGVAVVEALACDVHRFVDQVTSTVPEGSESRHLDVDAAIDAMLADTLED